VAARPLPAASLSFVLGAGLGGWLPQEPVAWAWAAASLLTIWSILLLAGRLVAGQRLGLAAFAVLGILRCQGDLAPLYAGAGVIPEGEATAIGRVATPAQFREGETLLRLERVRLRREGEGASALALPLQVAVAGECERYAVGDIVAARGSVRAIRGDRNLGWFPAPVVPRGSRVAGRLSANSPAWVRRIGHDPGDGPEATVLRWRAAADRFWNGRPGGAAPILNALTTGERAGIPADVQQAFTRSGLAHVLAISGMNVGVLAALVFVALRRLLALCPPIVLRLPAQPLAAGLTLPALWFFLLFSGGQIPVGRAVLSSGAASVAALAWRRIAPDDALAAAALGIVAADPRSLFSASFQLSFVATAALLLVAPYLLSHADEGLERRWPARLRRAARTLFVASLAASAATAPLVAFHFQQVSLAGVPANLVAVPLAGFIVLPAAWLSLAAAALPQAVAEAMAGAALFSADWLITVAKWFAAPSWASVATARPPPLLTLLSLGLVAIALTPSSGRLRLGRAVALVAVAASAGWWAIAAHPRGLLVLFLDVGQGLSAVIRAPGGATVLYDAGPRWRAYDAGDRIVVPALRKLGTWRLDAFSISHGHPDHSGGSEAVRRAFGRVETIAEACAPAAGGDCVLGGMEFRVLNPRQDSPGRGDENDRSLALLLSLGGTGVVLTGDAGPATAASIAAAAGPRPSRLALQAPHHGSSPEMCRRLAETLRPEVSVIPVGRNGYGHPRAGAVAALEESGRVLRTDRDGAVFLSSDGESLSVRTWRELSLGRSWTERLRWLAAGW
jgi:competence protein ComEC